MLIPLRRPDWHLRAACRHHPPDWWNPDELTVAGTYTPSRTRHTVLRCNACIAERRAARRAKA